MLRNVHIYDNLAAACGQSKFRIDVETPAEAIRALSVNFPRTFVEELRHGHYALVVGPTVDDGESIGLELLTFTLGKEDIHILPCAEGGKSNTAKGILTAVVGVALVAGAFVGAAAFAPAAAESTGGLLGGGGFLGSGVNLSASTGFFGISYGQIALFGASLILNGISTLLAKQTDPTKVGPTTASYLLNGPTNNTEQGGSMPLIYGRFLVGSTAISTVLKALEIKVGSNNFTTDVTSAKGSTITPGRPPDLRLPGMHPPLKPTITDSIKWQYPYPDWPGSGIEILDNANPQK